VPYYPAQKSARAIYKNFKNQLGHDGQKQKIGHFFTPAVTVPRDETSKDF